MAPAEDAEAEPEDEDVPAVAAPLPEAGLNVILD